MNRVDKLSYYNNPDYIPLVDERLYGTYCPNWIVNETGHPIEVWPVEEPEEIERHRVLAQTVLDNEAQKVHLKDTAKLRKGGNLLLRQVDEEEEAGTVSCSKEARTERACAVYLLR